MSRSHELPHPRAPSQLMMSVAFCSAIHEHCSTPHELRSGVLHAFWLAASRHTSQRMSGGVAFAICLYFVAVVFVAVAKHRLRE